MVPQRRRRRRVAQQVGTGAWRLIVLRGPQGFGFTISGQAPCVVSHVASGSPAERAGLRAGLVLVAVGGAAVARAPHEVVARLIAAAPQAIAITVTADREREPSDTSDDERVRPRPRYPQRPRARPPRTDHRHSRADVPRRRIADLDSFDPHTPSLVSAAIKSQYNSHLPQRSAISECCPAPHYQDCNPGPSVMRSDALLNGRQHTQNQLTRGELHLQCKAVVGYLGTIETPTPISNGSELQTVRNSIRKLRQEKRSSTIVLMTVLPSTMNLKKINGSTVAEYTRDRIIYVSCSSESDQRYFGLVTCTSHINSHDNMFLEAMNGNEEVEISHSCHVFTVDPKLVDHGTHTIKAAEFQITCSMDPVTNRCLEFPATAEYIVGVIRSMYSLQNGFASPGVENISKLAIKGNSPAVAANFSRNNNRPAAFRGMRQGRRLNGCVHDQRMEFPPNPIDNFRQDAQDFVANSPQPSNHSEITTTSSNSDSGIGFHNDCQNIAERILVVDFGEHARQLNDQAIMQNPYEAQPIRNETKQRPVGIVGVNYDMDSSFLSNTMPVVDGFGGRGQPLNHLDDVILRVCDTQPHSSFNNNITNTSYPNNPQRDITVGEATANTKDTYNYNDVHYGNIPSCSKEIYQNISKSKCTDDGKHLCPHYDHVYTESEGHHYEMISPQILDDCLDIDNINEKFNAIDIYQESCRNDVIYAERTIDTVPDCSQKSSNGTESYDNMTVISSKSHEFVHSGKTSMDDISVYSSRSQEYVHPNANHKKKMQASLDDMIMLGLGKTDDEKLTNDDQNFLHPGNLKVKIRKGRKPLNLLSRTRIMFHGKEGKKSVKVPERNDHRTRALSASVGDVCSPAVEEEGIPTASSEPDLRDNSSHHSESEQSSPFRRWTTGGSTGSSYRHHDQKNMYNKQDVGGKEGAAAGGAGGGGVTRWSLGLEHLLADPTGAAAFAAFLAKEFAAENIKFWWSCEQYRALAAETARGGAAREIWSRHLAEGAPEPVNVDAPARRAAALALDAAPADLFLQAQKQIFNLMKFDSYPRFLRSGVHAECARADLRGERPPYALPDLEPTTPTKLKKSASNVSERRRSGASLLPWSRLRAVSRDREPDTAPEPPQTSDVVSASAVSCSLCRVVLPDGATSVVGVEAGVPVRRLVDRLLSRRALHLACRAYDVVLLPAAPVTAVASTTATATQGDTAAACVDLDAPSTVLGGRAARVERRCVFRLELGGRRAVAVRCRPGKRLRHVLGPVLARYLPPQPAAPTARCAVSRAPVPLDTRVQDIDGSRIEVVFEEEESLSGGKAMAPQSPRGGEGEAEGDEGEGEEEDLALRLHEEAGDVQACGATNGVVRAALRPGPPPLQHAHPHPPDFLENLRQTQRVRLQSKPAPPPLPPKPRPHKHAAPTSAGAAAGALV